MYEAWRNRMVVSLVTIDVQGAFHGINSAVRQKRLLQREIPETLGQWVTDFCSNRIATITINTFGSETLPIAQATGVSFVAYTLHILQYQPDREVHR
jgi:hypothetical protein